MNVQVTYFTSALLAPLSHKVETGIQRIADIAPVFRVPSLSEASIEASPAIRHLFASAYPMITRAELARMLTHISRWTEIFLTDATYFHWICEDGIILPDHASFICLCDALRACNADVIYFDRDHGTPTHHLYFAADTSRWSELPDIGRCYLISSAGAEKLLNDMRVNGVRSGGLSAVLLQCPGITTLRAMNVGIQDLQTCTNSSSITTLSPCIDLTIGEYLVFIEAYDVIGCDVGARPAQHPVALILRPQNEWDAVNTLGFYKQGVELPRAWVRFPLPSDGVFIRSTLINCDTQFTKQKRVNGIACPTMPPYAPSSRPKTIDEVGDAFCVPASTSLNALTTVASFQDALLLPPAARVHARCNWNPEHLASFVQLYLPDTRQWGRFTFVEERDSADFIVYFANVVQYETNTLELVVDACCLRDAQKTLVFPIIDYSDALKPIAVQESIRPSVLHFLHVHSLNHNCPIATWKPSPALISISALSSHVFEKTPTHHPCYLAHYNLKGNKCMFCLPAYNAAFTLFRIQYDSLNICCLISKTPNTYPEKWQRQMSACGERHGGYAPVPPFACGGLSFTMYK